MQIRPIALVAASLLTLTSAPGCRWELPPAAEPPQPTADMTPQAYPKKYLQPSQLNTSQADATERLAGAARNADEVVVYEGLPHQNFDREKLGSEIREKNVLNLNEYPFYREPLTISKEDLDQIREYAVDPEALLPFLGPKDCGAFHPDFAVEWRVGEERYRLLLCFGCGEAKLFGPGLRSRNEIGANYVWAENEGWVKVLSKYRKHKRIPSH